MQSTHKHLQIVLEVAIIAAFAMALEYIPHKTGISGVEMSYGLIPISVLALRRGVGPAMAAGLTWGLLDMLLIGIGEGSVLNVTQGFIEYPIAFTVAGLGGLFYKPFQKALADNAHAKILGWTWAAVVLGVVAKYLCHFYAGIIFWGSYAPKGMPAWIYSLAVNGGSAIATGLLALIVLTALVTMAKHLFLPKAAGRLAAN